MTETSRTGTRADTDERPPNEDSGKPAAYLPGQPDMWVFVLFEMFVFTAYFAVYLFYRSDHPALILGSQAKLDLRFGTANTLLMLTSSWCVARCVQAARAGAFQTAKSAAYLTALFGAAFLGAKIIEWTTLVQDGHGFSSSEFFTYYYLLTGIHLLHLLIGFVVIGVAIYQLRSPVRRSQELVETSAVYWHTVDLIWVLIFALLYVVR